MVGRWNEENHYNIFVDRPELDDPPSRAADCMRANLLLILENVLPLPTQLHQVLRTRRWIERRGKGQLSVKDILWVGSQVMILI